MPSTPTSRTDPDNCGGYPLHDQRPSPISAHRVEPGSLRTQPIPGLLPIEGCEPGGTGERRERTRRAPVRRLPRPGGAVLDADDLAGVQDTLATAWRTRDRYDPDRGSARTWLLMLTAEHARRHIRRAHLIAVPTGHVERAAAEPPRPDPDIARAIVSLSERQRLAVELFYYLDLPVAEVATVMNCSAGTVKSTLADARTRLRSTLGDDLR